MYRMVGSLCCAAETNVTLYVNCISITTKTFENSPPHETVNHFSVFGPYNVSFSNMSNTWKNTLCGILSLAFCITLFFLKVPAHFIS